jgi:hypothetical protein
MVLRALALALVAAACAPTPDPVGRLAARRAALGLSSEPLPFAEAMERMEAKAYESFLVRVGSRRHSDEEVLDAAVDIENLLARADGVTAEARPPDPPTFDDRLRAARERASAFARAVASGGRGEAEAGELLACCMQCHLIFRKPR